MDTSINFTPRPGNPFSWRTVPVAAVLILLWAAPLAGQTPGVKTTFVPLPGNGNGVLFEPETPNSKSRSAVLNTHEGTSNNLNHPSGPQLASRGYRVFIINFYGDPVGFEGLAPLLADAVRYLRGLPGVQKVVLLGHSGGGPVMSFYQNVAENGPGACQSPDRIYPCRGKLTDLPKADGLVLLDSHIGTGFQQLTYVDPAIRTGMRMTERDLAFDMFNPRNGFDPTTRKGAYSSEFTRNFFAGQAARNNEVIDYALSRLSKIEKGAGDYKDDEPFVVPASLNARLLQADVRLVSSTHDAHPLLKADGTIRTQIVESVRPSLVGETRSDLESLHGAMKTTVRQFLASFAMRAGRDYNMSANAITGVDWASTNTSAVVNIEGVHMPTLIVAMSCHYFLVPDEVIYNHAAASDKQYMVVEGATHGFAPCRPGYGDTRKKVFDQVDAWLSDGKRFTLK